VSGGLVGRRGSRDDDQENPAWPGLVDLFAFGMVTMLLLWVSAIPEPPKDPELTPQERERRAQVEILEGIGKVLKDKPVFGQDALIVEQNPPAIRVVRFSGQEIFFDSAEFVLSDADRKAIGQAAVEIRVAIASRPELIVVVNGTADPEPFRPRPTPPRDNIELSALRAAEVSRILAAEGLEKRLQVVGLGTRGEAEGKTREQLREYRKVFIELRTKGAPRANDDAH